MSIKGQAIAAIGIIGRLESCIAEIKSTGDLSQWMSPDGIALLNSTLMRIKERGLILERLVNAPAHDITSDFVEEGLMSEIENYENLVFHLTGTLKVARGHQASSNSRDLAPPTEAR